MSDSNKFEIVERDEAGNITTTYVTAGGSRVDVIVRKGGEPSSLCLRCSNCMPMLDAAGTFFLREGESLSRSED